MALEGEISGVLRGEGLLAVLRCVNAARDGSADGEPGRAVDLESFLDDLFGVRSRLAAYGTLAPGQRNHDVLQPVGGSWSEGSVRGDLHPLGWGADVGFPGLRWRPDGPKVRVHLLTSARLGDHWKRLDEFEGECYSRILVPVETASGAVTVANLYAVRLPGG